MEIAEAKKALMQASAGLMVKKEQAEAEVAALEARERELSEGAARAEAAGATELLAETHEALTDVRQRLALQSDLHATLATDLEACMKELKELDGLKGTAQRVSQQATVAALTDEDPFTPSVEARALENARNGILELEARAEVQAEMAAETAKDADLRRRLAALGAEDKDAAARAQLEALKAARRAKAGGGEPPARERGPSDDEPAAAEGEAPAPKRPKRTL